jgi:hypothetical protein
MKNLFEDEKIFSGDKNWGKRILSGVKESFSGMNKYRSNYKTQFVFLLTQRLEISKNKGALVA